jgi:purine-binding chemotaxis protein CheW
MNNQYSYLIFRINNSLYGINTLSVKEIFLLPELTPIPQAPHGIVGAIDVRGHILPIMDLNVRFGQQQTGNYCLSDQIIVLEQEDRLGIIVNQVYEVRNIPEADIANQIRYDRQTTNNNEQHFIAGIVRSDERVLIIINLVNLLEYVSEPNYISKQEYLDRQTQTGYSFSLQTKDSELMDNSFNLQAPITSEALAVLRERANRLRQIETIDRQDIHALNLAIVSLNEELFSVELKYVREFTNIDRVIPVPCCPSHIVGNMNLRGEILTLVDISQLLNLPPINLKKVSQLMVVEVEGLKFGLTIEKVHDTITVDAKAIDSVPAANYSTSKKYFQGTLSYQEKMVGILDIAKILQDGNLVVDQAS